MNEQRQAAPLIRFGLYEVDHRAQELRREGRTVPLQNQPFLLLTTLLERPGEVVSREELKARLWPNDGYGAFDLGINTAVRKLRQALGDSAENPRFIETLPKVGYRFVAPVGVPLQTTPRADKAVAPPRPSSDKAPPQRRVWWVWAISAVLAIIRKRFFLDFGRAVLPFSQLA
jgi:DNA-binding winged helix-turn-helix (wHTH) protein